jgi:hypothetical protein
MRRQQNLCLGNAGYIGRLNSSLLMSMDFYSQLVLWTWADRDMLLLICWTALVQYTEFTRTLCKMIGGYLERFFALWQ